MAATSHTRRSVLYRCRNSDEQGEISSWLILAAGLTLAAALAVTTLQGTISELASRVGSPAAASVGGSGDTDGSTVPVDESAVSVDGAGDATSTTPAGPEPIAMSPSDEATDALKDVVDDVDRGDDLGLSEGELEDVLERFAGLSDEELDYVLSNLSDEQLERIFHNVEHTCWLCDDLSADGRRDFYDDLLRSDQEQRNRIAAALSDAKTISEDNYLDILLGLEVDISLGEKPSGAEIDALILAALDPDHIAGPIADGEIGEGRVLIVNDQDYLRAWTYEIRNHSDENKATSTLTYLRSRGFVDAEGRLWVKHSGSDNSGTAIHEVVHGYSDDAIRGLEGFNEGVTEYFTREVLKTIDDPSTAADEAQDTIRDRGYDANYQFVQDLVSVVGEDALANAYFDGDVDALEDAYIAATNRPSKDFDALLELLDSRSADDPETELVNEDRQRWADATDLLTGVPAS